MRRRDFFGLLGGAAAGWPLEAGAEQPKSVARIGFLATSLREAPMMFDALRQGFRELGYVEGQNLVIFARPAEGKVERFAALARELVQLKVDVIVASNSLAGRAAKQATSTIPIVVPVMGDPVGDGLVASLARPGGNVTGLTFLGPELLPKRLALLKEVIPSISLAAALWHPGAYGERTMRDMRVEAEAAARSLGLRLELVAVQGPEDFDQAFSAIAAQRADALIVFPSPMLFTYRKRIVDLAVKHRLPSMAMAREFPEIGGLMAYGVSIADLHRRAAGYVDKILKGAKPSDLPVEQPVKFEFVINLKAAKALVLTISEVVLARADEVID
jgi:putative ABC transport system substrate-binding protein